MSLITNIANGETLTKKQISANNKTISKDIWANVTDINVHIIQQHTHMEHITEERRLSWARKTFVTQVNHKNNGREKKKVLCQKDNVVTKEELRWRANKEEL